jgi:predicted nucleotidyltransferase
MDMQREWVRGLREWAQSNDALRQIWLVGSRAHGKVRMDTDVDLMLALMPNFAFETHWKQQLQDIVGRNVNVEPLVPDEAADVRVHREGVLLWARPS